MEQVETADPQFVRQIVDAMSRYLAALLSTRCTMLVTHGNYKSLSQVEETFDATRPFCRSCGVQVVDRLLCDRCRRIPPILEFGPTIVESMYRSSNPAYTITPEMETIMRKLKRDMALAADANLLCGALAEQCQFVHAEYARADGRALPPPNVRFDRALVQAEGGYYGEVSCGHDFPVPVGGLGVQLRNRVGELAHEWLHQIDRTVRLWFDVPVARTEDEAASVDGCCRRLAGLIADRVALFDAPDANQSADQHLSAAGCEHLAELQHVRCKYYAKNGAFGDVTGLVALLQLVRDRTDEQGTLEAVIEHRANMARMLRNPPPELLRRLPSVMRDYDLATLRDVLGNQRDYTPSSMTRAVMDWRAAINTAALAILIEGARDDLNGWKLPGNLLNVVFSGRPGAEAVDRAGLGAGFGKLPAAVLRHPAARLPAASWAHSDGVWYLIPKTRHEARRTGLDAPGLRIVALCSIVHRLLVEEQAWPVFQPGCVAVEVLYPTAMTALHRGAHGYKQLKNQLQPMTVGIEWGAAVTDIKRWKVTHIDNDVRDAVRHLSDYSFAQLSQYFGAGSRLPSTVRGSILTRLLVAVRDRLIVKPPSEYTDFVPSVICWALPIVREYRHSIGFADTARADPIGDLLRLHPAVRNWTMADGELRLTVKDLRGTPPALKVKLDELCEERKLVVKRRPRRGACWTYCLSEQELYFVLSAHDAWGISP